ncbi:putative urease accessory protein [Geobacillus kaustophilus]|uniref:Putative urease accessory protein n=1 Tax=Geobacillus kaustophilus TaxID=1462 RepID=A0A0D8BNF6_GEOKU|nr:putative urease accessory protein [Geobacillus kaustophilus]
MGAGAISTLIIGLFLGIKHSLEPDHVIAVSTIASKSKSFLAIPIILGIKRFNKKDIGVYSGNHKYMSWRILFILPYNGILKFNIGRVKTNDV